LAKLKHGKGKVKPNKRGFPWLWVIVALFIAVFAAVIWRVSASHNPPNLPNLKAAIVDQLYTNYPNENFTTEVKKTLEAYGFQVDVYQGSEVTVDFYRNLPSYDYKLIILRTHSGRVQGSQGGVACLFTNEPYNPVKYTFEQLGDRLMTVRATEDSPSFFGIRPSFIIKSMEGNFRNTVVIVAGCSGLQDNTLALTFTLKGASAFLAWDDSVGLDYVDKAAISLVKNLLSDKRTIKEAVDVTMAEVGRDPQSQAGLKYYPPQSSDETLRQLIQ
jgi:hypothetical protein